MSGRNFGRKEVPIDPTKIPPGIDASTFFSPQIPDEIRVAVPFMHETPIEIIQSSLQKIISSILANSITDEEFLAFQTELTQQQESFGIVFTALFCILKTAVSAKVTGASVSADLISMNIPAAVVENICQAIHASRSTVESRVVINRVGFPTLANLRWRIDVTISSGSLSRVMRPSILMQMILSNGDIKTFDVSIEQFNQLRYGVAKVLHDMQTLERHPIMKIVREFDRREEEERSRGAN